MGAVIEVPMAELVKCACENCYCTVPADKGVVRDGKTYCSEACAYECTETTCICVHNGCENKKAK